MTNIMNKILILLFCSLIFACSQGDEFDFKGGNKIYVASGDSTTFSFAVKPQEYIVHEIKVPIRVTGVATLADRIVTVELDKERTLYAKEGTPENGGHFTIEECVLQKDSVNSVIVIKLYRDHIKSTLKELGKENEDMTVGINIVPTGDFLGEMGEDELCFIVTFNDRLTIPSNWNSLKTYFGEPSLVKYQFIIDVLGISEFPTTGDNKYEAGELYYFQDELRVALVKYNNEHKDKPLTDENGNRVTF